MTAQDRQLELLLLGKPSLTYGSQPLTAELVSAKGQALLIYLAVTGQRHSRSALAGLLWGDMPEESARANLRLALSKLRKFIPDYLEATRLEIVFKPQHAYRLDVAEFEKLLKTDHSGGLDVHAVALYRGDFLEDFILPNAPEFDFWAAAQRERLHQLAVNALLKQILAAEETRNVQEGLAAARRLLHIDPWHENGHRTMMRLLSADGQRNAALTQYETFSSVLAEELGIEPDAETKALYAQIRENKIPQVSPVTPSPRHRTVPYNLPAQLTPFVGRKAECERLGLQLLDANCRLLTITGMGGIGKTRLAVELATAAAPHFPDGVIFVDLSPLADAELLLTAITDALHIPLSGSVPPKTQMIQFLASRDMLLVLDNFETVLNDVGLVADLLLAAPHLTLLVTSREPLNLNGEWLHPLGGLVMDSEADAADSYADALDLFDRCAHRIVPQFSMQAEMADIVELCELTGGMPLALELAAGWVKTMTVAEIVYEIRQDLGILNIHQMNRPVRQRSIEVVLNQMWQRLSEEEQDIFARMTIFQGAFERQAAQQVTGAKMPVVVSLTDKALLQRRGQSHFVIHPLVRQFGYGRLQSNPTAFAHTQATFAATFADFCDRRLPLLLQRDLQTMAALKQNQDNIRVVWEWACAHRQVAILDKMAQPLALYLAHYSYNQEHFQRFDTAVTALTPLTDPAAQRVLAYALLEMGNAYMTLGKLSDADRALASSETLYARYNFTHAPGLGTDPAAIRSIVAWMHSDFAAAVALGEKALVQARAGQNPANEAYAHFVLSGANIALGAYATAQLHARHAYALTLAQNDRWFLAYCHIELGKSAMALGDYSAADHHFETAFALRKEMGNLTGMGMARLMIGESRRRQRDWTASEQFFAAAEQIYRDIHNQMGLARAYAGLGDAATGLGQLAQARALYLKALNLVVTTGLHTYANTVLVGVGEWLLAVGQDGQAEAIFMAVAQDPSVSVDLKERALAWLTAVPSLSTTSPGVTLHLAASLVADLEGLSIIN